MIRLTTTTQKIQAALAGAVTTNQLPVTVSFADKSTTFYTGGVQLTNTNSTTQVDICSAPASSIVRDIDYLSIYNADTVASTVSIIFDNNGTDYTLAKVTLSANDTLEYTNGDGWKVTDASGSIKQSISSGTITGDLSVTGNTTLGDAVGDSVTINGATWSWAGSSTRLQADFSNATPSNRTIFQTFSANSGSFLGVMPNGTIADNTGSGVILYGNSDLTSTQSLSILCFKNLETRLTSGSSSGTFLPMTFYTSSTERARVDTSGNVIVGTGQLANNATDGFLYIPGTTSAAPSGSPTSYSGRHPMVVDDTNNRLYINIGGTWRFAALT